ncbi:hypothetical protein F6453_3520 [Marinobacter nauticus]|uniref:Uncharacterized protein n=1 Tax=Marinobacter nauticus TaxID=2743 RepID=A0A833JPA9_MARNT|nr:hypothetical protein F6453_3520 [Marinobacter nauticus]
MKGPCFKQTARSEKPTSLARRYPENNAGRGAVVLGQNGRFVEA